VPQRNQELARQGHDHLLARATPSSVLCTCARSPGTQSARAWRCGRLPRGPCPGLEFNSAKARVVNLTAASEPTSKCKKGAALEHRHRRTPAPRRTTPRRSRLAHPPYCTPTGLPDRHRA
jgi:hypothetical protein